jgi:serine/threonine protein kinase
MAQGPAGTPHYMSPEQIQEGVVITPQTDLWSLAVVMFECLSGRLPFVSSHSTFCL